MSGTDNVDDSDGITDQNDNKNHMPVPQQNGKKSDLTITEKKGYRVKTIHFSDVAGIERDVDSNRETFCCGLCCFTGCVYVAIGSFYFFILLPACIVLIVHGVNNKNGITLGLGIGLLIFFLLVIPCGYVLIRRCRRACRDRNDLYVINDKVQQKKKESNGPQVNDATPDM